MKSLTLLAIVALLWCLRELSVSIYTTVRRRRLRHYIRTEQTQTKFATIRIRLMELALGNGIDVDSLTFRDLYFVTTRIMRRPDQYPAIIEALQIVFLKHGNSDERNQLAHESRVWTADVREIVIDTARALNDIVEGYSAQWRFLYRLKNFLATDRASVGKNVYMNFVRKSRDYRRKKFPELEDIRRAQKVMFRLSHF